MIFYVILYVDLRERRNNYEKRRKKITDSLAAVQGNLPAQCLYLRRRIRHRFADEEKFVEELGWLDESEMLDITAIAQSSPGPIPINASVILGYRMCGIPGSLVAILGTALPPMIIISTISYFYAQFRSNQIMATALQVMRAGVAAVIFDVVWNLGANVIRTRRTLYILLMVGAFAAKVFFGVQAMVLILGCLGVGLLDLLIQSRSKSKTRADASVKEV